jgi:copper chaperone
MEGNMEKTFTVSNISCGHCVNSIKNELSELDNVQIVEGNAEQKTIFVKWSSPLTEGDIRQVLKTINYPAA